ncbi:MAG: universal stress protein [Actinomycetales bacterium]
MSQKPVVVGWDGSTESGAAVTWAAERAVALHRSLVILLAVHTPDTAAGLFPTVSGPLYTDDEIASILAPARELAETVAPGLTVETMAVDGHPVASLTTMSGEAELIVVGSRGRGPVSSTLLGSNSLAIASHCACPVVVVRGDHTQGADAPVVVGADGSQTAAKAVAFAAHFADTVGAPLVAVCAVPQPTDFMVPEVAIAPEFRDDLTAEAERFMAESLSGLCEEYPDLQVDRRLVDQAPAAALAEHGEGAQLVVVGSHGRGGFTGMLLGSVSRGVLFHAPCPIAVVR